MRATLLARCVRGRACVPRGRQLPFTPGGKELFQESFEAWKGLGSKSIGSVHLLLGALRVPRARVARAVLGRLGVPDSLAGAVLAEAGVTGEAVLAVIRRRANG